MIKYLRRHPVGRLTIGGGIGKITKLAQGAVDLHSSRSQVDFDWLAQKAGDTRIRTMRTALEAYELAGPPLAERVAQIALAEVKRQIDHAPQSAIVPDVIIVGRDGTIIGRAGP